MNRDDEHTIKITLSENTFIEFQVMAIRQKIDYRSLICDVLDKYIDKKKDRLATT